MSSAIKHTMDYFWIMLAYKNRGHIIIGLISLLLTLCFLSYFLKKEYQDEKAAIVLEARDEIFVKMFANFENKVSGSSFIKADSLSTINQPWDTFSTINEDKLSSSISIIINDSIRHTTVDQFQINSTDSASDYMGFKSLMIEIDEGANNSPYENNYDSLLSEPFVRSENGMTKNISPSQIIKRIIPQILIALLVLIFILMTYILFLKQLKKERKLSKFRNDFMSNMSHELKTPVSTISVALEALSSFNASDNRKMSTEYIDISKKEINRLGLLVDKALNISLYEQGKFITDKQTIDLNSEIHSIIKTLKLQLDSALVNLEYQHHGEDFTIYVDRTHIVNVIHNLIENAIKYSAKDPIINISLTELNHKIQLTITDNGIGISKEYQEKVFDKFFRVPQGNTHNTKGHGLGLSYVKEVITKHNGTIELQSQENIGSTFIIILPKSDRTYD